MIETVEIQGFKRYKSQKFNFSPLTVLAGLNGSGKTSLIHSLLLMQKASISPRHEVSLNEEEGLELGSADSVKNWDSDGLIEFSIESEGGDVFNWTFAVPEDDALYLSLQQCPSNFPAAFSFPSRGFSYVRADRLGPKNTLKVSALSAEAIEVGERGEFCAQVLETLGNKPLVFEDRLHPEREKNRSPFLKYELEKWLGEITTPVEVGTIPYIGSANAAMQFRTNGVDWVRAPNMGFGVSYALPIVLAGLITHPGGLLIVENPEAHLHPAGQSRMGVFLAWLAGRGVQVLVETHSDHVLNGMRRAIGEYGFLKNTDAIVNFFESDSSAPNVQELRFTAIGGVSNWPKGFFDQYQLDVSSLGRIRRRT